MCVGVPKEFSLQTLLTLYLPCFSVYDLFLTDRLSVFIITHFVTETLLDI